MDSRIYFAMKEEKKIKASETKKVLSVILKITIRQTSCFGYILPGQILFVHAFIIRTKFVIK